MPLEREDSETEFFPMDYIDESDANKDSFFKKHDHKIRAHEHIEENEEENFYQRSKESVVMLYNLNHHIEASRALAVECQIFSNDIKELCAINSQKCAQLDRGEHSVTWRAVQICLGEINSNI